MSIYTCMYVAETSQIRNPSHNRPYQFHHQRGTVIIFEPADHWSWGLGVCWDDRGRNVDPSEYFRQQYCCAICWGLGLNSDLTCQSMTEIVGRLPEKRDICRTHLWLSTSQEEPSVCDCKHNPIAQKLEPLEDVGRYAIASAFLESRLCDLLRLSFGYFGQEHLVTSRWPSESLMCKSVFAHEGTSDLIRLRFRTPGSTWMIGWLVWIITDSVLAWLNFCRPVWRKSRWSRCYEEKRKAPMICNPCFWNDSSVSSRIRESTYNSGSSMNVD